MINKYSRREFLSIAVNSSALAAAQIGSKKINKLIPYLIVPEEFHPGKWLFFNTTCRECPAGCGMYLRHQDGRVIKAEGNPAHPVNHGGLCPRGQSCVQGLYDPDRLKTIICRNDGQKSGNIQWQDAFEKIAEVLKQTKGKLIFVSNIQTGTLDELFNEFLKSTGLDFKLIYYEPLNFEVQKIANEKLFDIDAIARYKLTENKLIFSFGCDFLEGWISNVEYAYQFSQVRHKNGGKMIYVGPRFSMTASNADEFIQCKDLVHIAAGMLKIIIQNIWTKNQDNQLKDFVGNIPETKDEKIYRLAKMFVDNKSIALAGPNVSFGEDAKNLAAIVNLLNFTAGNFDQNIDFSQLHSLSKCATRQEIINDFSTISNNDVVIFHNCNPVYNIPGIDKQIKQAGNIIYMGVMPDETNQIAHWVLPTDYYLESWGDYEPWTGIYSLIQPTMKPIYNTLPPGDILIQIIKAMHKQIEYKGKQINNFYEMIQLKLAEISSNSPANIFVNGFQQIKKEENKKPTLKKINLNFPDADCVKLKLWLWNSIMIYDGSVANRGWLQENPEPISQLGWGNYIEIAPYTAEQFLLKTGDIAILKSKHAQLQAPIIVSNDVCERMVAVSIGYGHSKMGQNASFGINPYQLFGNEQKLDEVELIKTGMRTQPVKLVETNNQYGRQILRWQQKSDMAKITMPLPAGYIPQRDLYPPHENKKHRWVMTIDLDRCIGCGACAVACYAENNIAVVGPVPVTNGREMAWLKVVPYRKPDDKKQIGFLPMLCQHCDAAPCEPVCPVFAAVHNEQGLNSQIYNRCIGTRYCSNNCPYKVRRFNWFSYKWQKPLNLQLNPEVTVRGRGVMEKCTFCIQRIRSAEFDSKLKGEKIKDGTVQPACAQSCPTKVFTFGDLMDENSKVFQIVKDNPRRYQVLDELNTKPAVIYLKKKEV